MEGFNMNHELLRSVHFDYLHPVFVIMGFETCVKEAGCCFLKVAFDVIDENNFTGSLEETKLIMTTAASLIISRRVSSGREQKSFIANQIAVTYRSETRSWVLNSRDHTNDDSQTLCIVDEINIKEETSESLGNKSIRGFFAVISTRLLELCNWLILKMKSLISWRCK